MEATMRPVMALVPWGHAVEDFLDPIGLSLDDFVERMTGGWLFGYAAALKSAGWEPVIVCASRSVKKPARRIHASGAAVRLVPVRPSRPRRGLGLTLQGWFGTPAWGFFRALKAESASAMIVQEYEDARYDRLVTLGRLMGLPVYATFQGRAGPLGPRAGAPAPAVVARGRPRGRRAQSPGPGGMAAGRSGRGPARAAPA
jgi:starch synthase